MRPPLPGTPPLGCAFPLPPHAPRPSCSVASPAASDPPRRNRRGECPEQPDLSNLQRLTSQTHNCAQTRHGQTLLWLRPSSKRSVMNRSGLGIEKARIQFPRDRVSCHPRKGAKRARLLVVVESVIKAPEHFFDVAIVGFEDKDTDCSVMLS